MREAHRSPLLAGWPARTMHPRHEPTDQPTKAAARGLTGLLVVAGVTSACLAIGGSMAVPEDATHPAAAAAPDPDQQKKDDEFVARFERGQRLFGRGADEEAEKIFRALLAERPEQAVVHHALGLLLQFRRKPEEAATELTAAAKLAPDEAVIQRDTGQHLVTLGRAKEALVHLARAYELWEQDVETCVAYAGALRSLGSTAQAEAVYRKAIANDANSVDAAVGLAACLVPSRPEESLRLVEKATGGWVDVALVRSLANERLARWDAASAELVRVLELAPPGAAGLTFLEAATTCAVRCGDAKLAEMAAARWIDVAGGKVPPPEATFALATAREARGDHDSALAALAAPGPIEEEPSADERARFKLLQAAILIRAGRMDDARPVLVSLTAFAPERFDCAAAERLVGPIPAERLAERAKAPELANDVAWIESIAAAMGGDREAESLERVRAASLSNPRGEFPGLLVRRDSAAK